MHHYPFHPGDYMLDTAHLEPMEDLAYRRLLDLYYSSEKPIPTETELVSRRLRLGSELVNRVLKEFFELTENGWKHARCDAEIANYKARAEVAKNNGKLGGRPKKTDSVNLANPGETNSKANQEPRTKNQNQEPNLSSSLAEKKARTRTKPADDEFWIAELEKDTAYAGINIRAELGKMQRWCAEKHRTPSRMRFVNWLNRAERPMTAQGRTPRNQAFQNGDATAGKTAEQVLNF